MGLKINVAGLQWGWNKIVRDSHGNVALFDFYGAHAATKICFRTVRVCSDFTDTDCISISVLIILLKLVIYFRNSQGYILSIAVQMGMETNFYGHRWGSFAGIGGVEVKLDVDEWGWI